MSFSREEQRILTQLIKDYFKLRPNKAEEIIEDRIFYKKLTKAGLVKQYPLQFMFRTAASERLLKHDDQSSIADIAERLQVSEVSLYSYLKNELKHHKHDKNTYYYAVARYVPDKVSGEFANIGLIAVSGQDKLVTSKFINDISRIKSFFNLSDKEAEVLNEDIELISEEVKRYNKFDDTIGEGGYNYLCNMVFHIKRHPTIDSKSYTFNKIYNHRFEKKIKLEEFKEALYKKYIKEK